ncbi:MAG: AraC family transcriptional regulator ligand-binding domain-containing protein, partial [Ketobacteraceae bacterium]|nr:AraC family transcriptional regulator ligand-binding domain-containing protein [Ketobacteraceae bacterium]
PLSFITVPQYESLLSDILDRTGDPAIGLAIGSGITFGHHGKLAFAALSYPTIWDAIRTGRKFSRLMNRVLDIRLEETPDQCCIQLESPYVSKELYRVVIDMVMAMFCQQFRFMLRTDKTLLGKMTISFRYGKRDYEDSYNATFEAGLQFEADHNSLIIPHAIAHHSLDMADPIIAREFEEECDRLIATLEESRDVADEVRRLLFMATEGFPTINQVADQLHMSARTLRRRLQETDTSYQKILDDVRIEIARRYLSTTSRSVGQIAHLLGYSDQNSFSYGFKSLTGESPTQYRQRHR